MEDIIDLKELLCEYCNNGIPISLSTIKNTAEELNLDFAPESVVVEHSRTYLFYKPNKNYTNDEKEKFNNIMLCHIEAKNTSRENFSIVYVQENEDEKYGQIILLAISKECFSFELDALAKNYEDYLH